MTDCPRFETESLHRIIEHLRKELDVGESAVEIEVSDPDLGPGLYAGETVEHLGRLRIHRPFRVWVELADRLDARLKTPRLVDDGFIRLAFEPLRRQGTKRSSSRSAEAYGLKSSFQRISKLEDPGFVLDVEQAIGWMPWGPRPRILELGTNRGDAWALLQTLRPSLTEAGCFVGVDHSGSAIELARQRFPEARFVQADLADLPTLELGGPFDLVVAIGTLQSPGVDDRVVLRHVVQERLADRGSVLLGIPNCRYIDGEVSHGARMKNYGEPELSLVIKDIAYYRRYLQQHKRRVRVTGKNYLWVTAIPIASD